MDGILDSMQVLWDCEDANAFVTTEGNVLKVYMHIPLSLYGEHVKLVGESLLEFP